MQCRLILNCLLVGWFATFVSAEDKVEHTKDTAATIKKNLADKNAVLLDVRNQNEWDAGHLDGAILVPLPKLQDGGDAKKLSGIADLDKKIIYCHCRAGKRALTAAEILKKAGYDVRPLKQGYEELLKEGFSSARAK